MKLEAGSRTGNGTISKTPPPFLFLFFYISTNLAFFLSCAPRWKCKAYLYRSLSKSRLSQALLLAANSIYFSFNKIQTYKELQLAGGKNLTVECMSFMRVSFQTTSRDLKQETSFLLLTSLYWRRKKIALELIIDFCQPCFTQVAPEGRDVWGDLTKKGSGICCIPWESYVRTWISLVVGMLIPLLPWETTEKPVVTWCRNNPLTDVTVSHIV